VRSAAPLTSPRPRAASEMFSPLSFPPRVSYMRHIA